MKIETLLAAWGAVTGTIACVQLVHSWFNDRGRVKVEANMSTNYAPHKGVRVLLNVRAVNIGRRSVCISHAAVSLSKSARILPVSSPEQVTDSSRRLVASELCFFDSRGTQPIELKGDGGLYSWEIPLPQNPVFESLTKDGQRYGKGYITLTVGTKIEFEFYLVPDTEWERAKRLDATAPKSPPEINQTGVMF